ncbi:vegetative cell wall protein gp1-like [Triticum dicoccoides]|uniref:vegetative cell wall protein gp1-like n=1 Tax=Triticum dicoccoides TaxID=85692 RepID=UPI001890CA84|nr:vegetative cell wall protein gp1-like [Triticum dicoccoides]
MVARWSSVSSHVAAAILELLRGRCPSSVPSSPAPDQADLRRPCPFPVRSPRQGPVPTSSAPSPAPSCRPLPRLKPPSPASASSATSRSTLIRRPPPLFPLVWATSLSKAQRALPAAASTDWASAHVPVML